MTASQTVSMAKTTAMEPILTEPGDGESQNERRKRVEELWRSLDPQGVQELDFKGLKKGLRRIDHPMKNADDMLRDIIKMVDSNSDGKIQYEEFCVFVEAAERQLLLLFRSIDRDHDGRVNRDELRAAFAKTGLAVPVRRLNGFFDEIDMNHDGYISFDEWREAPLRDAFSYYATNVILNSEGDSMVSDDTLEGLGTTGFLLQALFGAILKLAQPSSSLPPSFPVPATTASDAGNGKRQRRHKTAAAPAAGLEPSEPPEQTDLAPSAPAVDRPPIPTPPPPLPPDPEAQKQIGESAASTTQSAGWFGSDGSKVGNGLADHKHSDDFDELDLDDDDNDNDEDYDDDDDADPFSSDAKLQKSPNKAKRLKLTHYLPHPGYFLAGALAGGISRTATAPFDRLKVYLLVSTNPGSTSATINAVKHGHPLAMVRNASKPISEAIATLYKAGGLRTFFAGNGLNVVKIMPETAIKFGSYEAAKRAFATLEGHGDPTRISPYSKFVAGGVAGMVAQFFVYPLDTLKFRLQCETVQGGPTGRVLLLQTARKMWATGGMHAAYRGVTMGLIGMFPYSAIDMGTFELLKGTYTHYKARYYGIHEEDAGPGNVATGIIGATSGAFGASVVYPLNVLRTRLQTQGTVMHPATYTGIWDVAQRTLAKEGWRGLYKGLTPNLLKVAPALSITWVVYENSKRVLGLP